MDRESMNRLKFDRRLMRRRGWISEEELAAELEGLPDASHKIAPAEPEAPAAPAAPAEPTAPGLSSAPEPSTGFPPPSDSEPPTFG
jgi:hypothetical protein